MSKNILGNNETSDIFSPALLELLFDVIFDMTTEENKKKPCKEERMKSSNNPKWNKIIKSYEDDIEFYYTQDETPFSLPFLKRIFFNKQTVLNPTETDLFDLLHEIGHIQTNTKYMATSEQEFRATQWAIDNAKRYNIKVTKTRIKQFQKYIWDWLKTDSKKTDNFEPLLCKEQLTLKFEK